ncbi:hypothetical protein [Corynebacterium lubricantis]|uniref:hypothetical protein n=1 Tax=Corynebacterium lubricantis TaxID=541095 RepID=UPI0003725F7E|nr:hypothetical protein [Corynebacterium lubricantis]
MNTSDFIIDLVQRTRDSLAGIRELTAAELTAHPADHPNSVSWLLWHAGREMDVQFAQLSDTEEVWSEQDFSTRFDLGPVGDTIGYGHSREEATQINTTDQSLLNSYVLAVLEGIDQQAKKWSDADWDFVIGEYDGQKITRRVRTTSLLIDAIEHLAQAMYVTGMPQTGAKD